MIILIQIILLTIIFMFIGTLIQIRYKWSEITLEDKLNIRDSLKLMYTALIKVNPFKLNKYYKTILLYDYHVVILYEYINFKGLNFKELKDSDVIKIKKLIYDSIEGKEEL